MKPHSSNHTASSGGSLAGQKSSEEMALEKDHAGASLHTEMCNSTNEVPLNENKSSYDRGANILHSGQEREDSTLKRPMSTEEHRRKRRLGNMDAMSSGQNGIPNADSRKRQRNQRNQSPDETRSMAMEAQGENDSFVLNVSLPRNVHLANLLNNPDSQSLLLATLSHARSITVGRAQAVESGTAMSSEEHVPGTDSLVSSASSISSTLDSPSVSGMQQSDTSSDRKGNEDKSNTETLSYHSPAGTSTMQEDSTALSLPAMQLKLKFILLEELLMANEVWNQPENSLPSHPVSSGNNSLNDDHYNLLYFMHYKSIKQHRRLSTFKDLSMGDRVALMDTHLTEILLCRFALKDDWESCQSHVDNPDAPKSQSDLQKSQYKSCNNVQMASNMGYAFAKLRSIFPEEYRHNDSILVLISALALFNPSTPRLVFKDEVEQKRRIYLDLLQHYLQTTYGERQSKVAYRCLTVWLNCVSMHSEIVSNRKVLYELDPATCELRNLHIVLNSGLS